MEWSEHAGKSHQWSSFCHATRQSKKDAGNRFCLRKNNKDQAKYEHRNETIEQIYAPCNDTYSEEEKAEFSRNYLAQLTQYQTTMILSSWETSMEG